MNLKKRFRKEQALPQEAPCAALCSAVQPDGRAERCIRFDGHEGPHQNFVAQWNNGDSASRRRSAAPFHQGRVKPLLDAVRQPQFRPLRSA